MHVKVQLHMPRKASPTIPGDGDFYLVGELAMSLHAKRERVSNIFALCTCGRRSRQSKKNLLVFFEKGM